MEKRLEDIDIFTSSKIPQLNTQDRDLPGSDISKPQSAPQKQKSEQEKILNAELKAVLVKRGEEQKSKTEPDSERESESERESDSDSDSERESESERAPQPLKPDPVPSVVTMADADLGKSSDNKPPNLLRDPWRDVGTNDWTKEERTKLKNEIATHDLTNTAGIKHINVLLIGEIGAGKSSFFNSIESVFEGYVTSRANAGAIDTSLTTQYRQYFVSNGLAKDEQMKDIKFRFCDSMGLEGGEEGLSADDMGKIMDGHVEDMAELSGGNFTPDSHGYKANPTENDRIHCVVFVISADGVRGMDEDVMNKIKQIRVAADRRHLYPLVILSKIDSICADTEKKASNVYHSRAIQEKITEVSGLFGIKENQIHPVRNYKTQTECSVEMDILTLRALKQVLRYSKDYLKNKLEMKNAKNKRLDRELAERRMEEGSFDLKKISKKRPNSPPTGCKEPVKSKDQSLADSTQKVKVLKEFDCYGAEGQISVGQDEMVEKVMADVDGWTKVRNQKREEGLVPTKCLAKEEGKILIGAKTRECFGAKDQIDIHKDEKVHEVIPDVNGWTKVRNSQGDEGLVPTPCLAKEQKLWYGAQTRECFGTEGQIDIHKDEELEEVMADVEGWTRVKNKRGDVGLVPTKLLVVASIKTPKMLWGARTRECFGFPDQIDIHEGEEVEQLLEDQGGWTKVKNKRGQEGLVPTQYLVETAKQKSKTRKSLETWECFGVGGQIDIHKDEELEELIADTNGWTKVKNKQGKEGLVPTELLASLTVQRPKMMRGTQTRECFGASGQIDIHKDEEVEEVMADINGFTKVRNKKGDVGLVPTKLLASTSVGENNNKMRGTQTWDCFGAEGFISIQIGEEVEAMTGDVDGWTEIRKKGGEEGKVPSKILETSSSLDKTGCVEKKTWRVQKLFSMKDQPGTLDLEKGEVVEEVEPDREGWTMLKKEDGTVGLAPTSFLGTC